MPRSGPNVAGTIGENVLSPAAIGAVVSGETVVGLNVSVPGAVVSGETVVGLNVSVPGVVVSCTEAASVGGWNVTRTGFGTIVRGNLGTRVTDGACVSPVAGASVSGVPVIGLAVIGDAELASVGGWNVITATGVIVP